MICIRYKEVQPHASWPGLAATTRYGVSTPPSEREYLQCKAMQGKARQGKARQCQGGCWVVGVVAEAVCVTDGARVVSLRLGDPESAMLPLKKLHSLLPDQPEVRNGRAQPKITLCCRWPLSATSVQQIFERIELCV